MQREPPQYVSTQREPPQYVSMQRTDERDRVVEQLGELELETEGWREEL